VGVTASARPGIWRPRYRAYGPITDARPADRHKIAELIQRCRVVTDERLVAQALAYARYRARFCGVLGLFFLAMSAGVGELSLHTALRGADQLIRWAKFTMNPSGPRTDAMRQMPSY
jgi:hypothetical protein